MAKMATDVATKAMCLLSLYGWQGWPRIPPELQLRPCLLPGTDLSASFFATMPTYEYTCMKCGHHFDLFQSISERAIGTCPKELCARKHWGKGKVKRRISAGAGLIFKGSGFYITDYRSEKYKEAAKKDAPAAAPSESKSAGEGKTASTKPEAKPTKAAPATTSDSGSK